MLWVIFLKSINIHLFIFRYRFLPSSSSIRNATLLLEFFNFSSDNLIFCLIYLIYFKLFTSALCIIFRDHARFLSSKLFFREIVIASFCDYSNLFWLLSICWIFHKNSRLALTFGEIYLCTGSEAH